MGPGKNLVPPFISPPAIIQFDPLALSVFVMRENVARGFVKRNAGSDGYTCEKTENDL